LVNALPKDHCALEQKAMHQQPTIAYAMALFAVPEYTISLILELLQLLCNQEACADRQWQKEELMERGKLEATLFRIGFWQSCLLVLPPLQLQLLTL